MIISIFFRTSIALILMALVMSGRGAEKVSAVSPVNIQLFTLEENSQQVSEFPFGRKYVIAVVTETEDLTKLLPITLTVRHARVQATDRIPNDPTKYCRDIHVCALPGPIISPKDSQTAIEIVATSNIGEQIAIFKQGDVISSNESPAVPNTSLNLPVSITKLSSNPTPPPWQDPIVQSLFGIGILSGLGLFAGWPIARRLLSRAATVIGSVRKIPAGILKWKGRQDR